MREVRAAIVAISFALAITICALVCGNRVLAHPPESPPPPLSDARAYVAFDTICPDRDGKIERCTVYVARWPTCECPEPAECQPPCPDPFSCVVADVDSSGTVDTADMIACSAMDGKRGEACGAAVQVYWDQSCQPPAASAAPSGQDSASSQ
jgi:hypothetical protein